MSAPGPEDPVGDVEERWPVHATERVYDGKGPFAVRTDTISAPGNPEDTFDRLVVEHPGAVVILAVDARERVLVLHQYRHPAATRLVELPAGLLDVAGEDPELAGRRELREEGLVLAGSWTHLFTTWSSPGLSSERIAYYLAEDLSDAPDRDGFEPAHEEADMTLSWVPVDELVQGVRDGRITDGPTAQAVLGYLLLRR